MRPQSSDARGATKQPSAGQQEKPARRDSAKPAAEQRQSRPVVQLEVTSPRLYVGNLSFDATESDLFELFSGAGSVVNVEIVCSRQTERSKGFAFVQMQTIEEAKRAVQELHDKEYMGRKLLVSGARPLESRSDRSSQPEQ
ncbi:MAG: RNA-binding protein [Terrimicrobiaceae bacterium]|nr:RNA-binding protein [Terrimicrobiaceae bacterium]